MDITTVCYVNGRVDSGWSVGDLDKREVRCPGCGRWLKPRHQRQAQDGTVIITLPRHNSKERAA